MQRRPVTSSVIRSIGYNAGTRVLELEFHGGGVYQYEGISASVHAKLLAAPSLGQYFDTHIKKPGYAYKRVD